MFVPPWEISWNAGCEVLLFWGGGVLELGVGLGWCCFVWERVGGGIWKVRVCSPQRQLTTIFGSVSTAEKRASRYLAVPKYW